MAVPTLTSVSPNQGHTGGLTLVVLTGTNFRLPTAPPATGLTTAPPQSVRVRFAGFDATKVEVFSATEIQCLTPKAELISGLAERTVSVEVANIDDTGVVIPGEVATLASAFSYRLPVLSGESDLARAVRSLIQELKRQILPNVVFTTHTDYDASTGDLLNMVELQTLPALVLANLDVQTATDYPANDEEDHDVGGERFVSRRQPEIVTIKVDLTGLSNDPIEILNLLHNMRAFFKKNPYLYVDRDPGNLALGQVRYPLIFRPGSSAVTHLGENANVESVSGEVRVEGVRIEGFHGAPTVGPIGMPATMPHEATVRWGYKALEDEGATDLDVQKKPED